MADRGFDIEEDLIPLGVRLNIPPFLRGKTQLSYRETTETRRIASVRIHVERAMERIKNYHIFDRTIPASLTDLANQMSFCLCYFMQFLATFMYIKLVLTCSLQMFLHGVHNFW